MSEGIVDSHAHLSLEYFGEERPQVIERAFAAGVDQIVNAGVDLSGIDDLLSLCSEYPGIFCGVGVHPHEAKSWKEDSADVLLAAACKEKVVAIGECGLDFHYNLSDRQQQLAVFARQVDAARELDKPLIVHSRNAFAETFEILHRQGQGKVRGVFHCFTGGVDLIGEIEKLDFYVSFSGILTFPKSKEIQQAAEAVRSERLLVETDCPYLSPQGHRGKRNEPAFVWLVAEKLAELRQTSKKDIAHLTSSNARQLFRLPVPLPAL